jgi:hypothetical protein
LPDIPKLSDPIFLKAENVHYRATTVVGVLAYTRKDRNLVTVL